MIVNALLAVLLQSAIAGGSLLGGSFGGVSADAPEAPAPLSAEAVCLALEEETGYGGEYGIFCGAETGRSDDEVWIVVYAGQTPEREEAPE